MSTRAGPTLQVIRTFIASVDRRRLVLRPSVQRVLALLAVIGDLSRVDAAGLLWPDMRHVRAMANLRTALWRVRSDAPGFVCEEGDHLRLSDIRVDLYELREWAWRALRADETVGLPQHWVADELLPGWSDEWLVQPREELRLLKLYALEAVGQRLLLAGRFGEAAGLALAAVNVDPLRESANRLLIEIYMRDGNSCDALRQFEKYERLLHREMHTEPGPGMTALVGSLTARR